MELHTVKFDADRQDLSCTVTVPLDSSFGIAVGVKYQGKDVHIRKNEILMDGQGAIDVVDDKYAVFRLSSDGNEGIEGHEVKSVTDGMTVKELSYKFNLPAEDLEGTGPRIYLCDTLNGVTIKYPVGSETGKSPTFTDKYNIDWPLILIGKDTTANKWTYAGIYTYMYGVGADGTPDYNKPVARVWREGGRNRYNYGLEVPNADYTNWVRANEFTVPDNGMFLYLTGYLQYKTDAHFDYTYIERISCDFGLVVQEMDNGTMEGYGDDYIFKNTTNLSGTYTDGTDFSYTVPVVDN